MPDIVTRLTLAYCATLPRGPVVVRARHPPER
jgi:hypothetical protein